MKKTLLLLLIMILCSICYPADQVRVMDRTGQEVNPGADNRWPVSHINSGTAGVTQFLTAPGNTRSHFVTGFIMTGGAAADGFYFLRQNAVAFTNSDTLTIPDNSTDLDWDTLANDGDFAVEMWLQTAADIDNIATLLVRGDETSDGWKLEIASGKAKFTFHDSSDTATITGDTDVDDGSWHFIVATVDRDSATGLNIYVDGSSDATAVDPTSVLLAMDGGTTVVSTGVAAGTYYMSALALYIDNTLSAATVLSNYNSGIGQKYEGDETNLSFAYNLDEGSGTSGYDRLLDTNHTITLSSTAWVPSRLSGATAEVNIDGVPINEQDMTDAVGKFQCGIGTNFGGVYVKFPHPVKIGRNCPLSILETNGAFDLIVFGFTSSVR